MKDIALILMSHGNMACETLKSAEMIVGPMENAYALSMGIDEGMTGINSQLGNLLENEKQKYKHIFAIVDLIGGTPCNVAIEKLAGMDNVTLISGLNLAMVIEFAMSQHDDYEGLKGHLIDVGRSGIIDILAMLKK